MILIAAGSNLPFCGVDSQQLVLHSFFAIERFVKIVGRARLYQSPAWPDPTDPDFINTVISVETELCPAALLAALHGVETAFGRRRGLKNAPRSLDLDLIAYNDVVSDGAGAGPVLPHPRLAERGFVLAPLAEIAPHWRPPGGAQTAAEMLRALPHSGVRALD